MQFSASNRNLKVSAALLLGFLLVSASCVELQDDAQQATGFLAPMSVSFDVSVEDMVDSKSLPLPEIEAPLTSELTFTVKDNNGNVKYHGIGPWTESLVVPVGRYTVEAVYGTNGFGEPGFIGSATGTVDPYEKETVNLTLQLSNSLVAVSLSSDLAVHFTPDSKVTFACGGESHEADFGKYCFVPSGTNLSLTLSGLNSAGNPSTLAYTLPSPAPRTAYEVVCGKTSTDWPSISLSDDSVVAWASRIYITKPASFGGSISAENQSAVVYEAIPSGPAESSPVATVSENGVFVIKGLTPGKEYQVRARVGALVSNVVKVVPKLDGFSATAAHTYTGGELDGTDVTSTFLKPDVVKNAISSWTISLCKSDGTVLRSGLQLGTSDGSAITSTKGWPYLPTGSGETYMISASATMFDGEIITIEEECPVPTTPDFTISLKSYTSYDKYAATNGMTKNISQANNCDPSTIYDAGAYWGISTNLMKNENYAKTLVIKLNDDSSRTYNVEGEFQDNRYYENITSCAWQAHTLAVSMTFDGKTCSETRTHHITGLPHKTMPPTQSLGWSKGSGRITWNSDNVELYYSAATYPHIVSPEFYLPVDVNVKVDPNIARNYYWASVAKGDLQIARVKNGSEINIHKASLASEKSFTTSLETIMAQGNECFIIRYCYAAAGPRTYVYQFNILYR